MELGARRLGKSAWDIAEEYTAAFRADLGSLNIKMPSIWCKATDHIPEQIQFIEELEKKGFTYRTEDGIYFDSQKLDSYGHLARLDIGGLRAGARVQPGARRFVTDFALWKFSPEAEKRQMEWNSPWGTGFPGWHIECSAMAAKYLGDYFRYSLWWGRSHLYSPYQRDSANRGRERHSVSQFLDARLFSSAR